MSNTPQPGNYNSQIFTNNNDIDNFFKQFGSLGFVDWFNKNIKQTQPWAPIVLINQVNWEIVWANLPILFGRSSINLIEFLSINSIIINETGGKFVPVSEGVNKTSNIAVPGIAYEFNSIKNIGKASYNTLSTNKTALSLFNDPVYISAHGTKPLSSTLKNTTDSRWSGTTFPIGFSGLNINDETSGSGIKNTFLTEADFFKFRGRGYIQTTGRNNYKPLISYILNYTGDDPTILSAQKTWSSFNGNIDSIASSSTNMQWDNLFQQKNFIIANYAVYIHSSQNGNYNTIDSNQSNVNLQKSITNVSKKIGGVVPASTFLSRVQVQLDLINSYTAGVYSPPVVAVSSTQSAVPGRLASTGQDPNSQVGSNSDILGAISTITNIFKPSIRPTPISFDISGNSTA